jgi:hypothetical protein
MDCNGKSVMPATLAQALEVSRQFLVSEPNGEGFGYICLAIKCAVSEGLITEAQQHRINTEIDRALCGSSTFAAWLHIHGNLPQDVKAETGYRLDSPKYIVLRDKFIERIKDMLNKREMTA